MGNMGESHGDVVLAAITVFSFSIVIIGVSAAIIAKYGENKVATAHLVLSLFAWVTIAPMLFAAAAAGSRKDVFLMYLIIFCIYFPLMIVLAADPSTRDVLNGQAVQYANQTQKIASVGDTVDNVSDFIELPLNAGEFLAIFIFDCAFVVLSVLGMTCSPL